MTDPLILTRAEASPESLDPARRYQEFVASTTTLDAHSTIVKQDWDLSRYEKNPIVLRDHDTGRPIGTAAVRVEDGSLIAGVTFATDDKDADRAWNLVKQRVLRGMSVGFRPTTCEILETDDDFVVVYGAPRLFELSVVGVPSNEDTLSRAYGAAADAETEIRRSLSEKRDAARTTKENTMADKTTAPEAIAAPAADILSRADHEGILRDTRNTHDTAIRAMQLTVEKAKSDLSGAEERAATAEKKIKDLDDDRLVRKLDSYVGKKITPAERDVMLETIRTSESLFDKQVALRPDIIGERVIPVDDTTVVRATGTPDATAVKMSVTRSVADFMKLGMSKNDALSAATRAAALTSKEVALCRFPHSTTPPVGASLARS